MSATAIKTSHLVDRSRLSALHLVREIWTSLQLPLDALDAVRFDGGQHILQSSYKIGHLAQATIALSALSAALLDSIHNNTPIRQVSISLRHAAVEFASEQLYTLDGKSLSKWGPLSGLYATRDGHVRIHDNAIHHRRAALKLLNLPEDTTRAEVADKVATWSATDLEAQAAANNAVIYALRTYDEWDAMPQAQNIDDLPVQLARITQGGDRSFPSSIPRGADRCLRGLKVVELTRVIAGPIAGRALAAHGADVTWITCPHIAPLPESDIDVSRGKKELKLDLNNPNDKQKLDDLLKDADVFIQSYRPGSMAKRGYGPADVAKINPNIVYANLSAWGSVGPWRHNRGFDSMVQTVSGLNRSEAEHFDPRGETVAKPLPVQGLDHGAGYFLATGICAALYRRAMEGGAWEVRVCLVAVMKYLRSLGQLPGDTGFVGSGLTPQELVTDDMMETTQLDNGLLKAVKHSGSVDGKMPGWDVPPERQKHS